MRDIRKARERIDSDEKKLVDSLEKVGRLQPPSPEGPDEDLEYNPFEV